MKARHRSEAGSYQFGASATESEELQRLKLQATVAIKLEREAWQAAGLRSGMRVLDLACGPGFISCELARAAGPGQVTGVDLSPELLAAADHVRQTEQVQNVTFTAGSVYDLPLPEAQFDFVYARFLFQHLARPRQALDNIRRVLKPGGILCVLDIDDNWTSFAPGSEAFTGFIRQSGAGQKRRGGNRLIGSQLFGLLRRAGFRNVAVRIHPLTTEELGLRTFLGLAVMFRAQMLSKPGRLLALPRLGKIRAAAQDPDAWGAVGIFLATGIRD